MNARPAVAFQGVPGAFSWEACRRFLPDHEPVAFAGFGEALAAVTAGTADCGLLPLENSLAGPVPEVAHLLPRSGLVVVSEHELTIRLCLLAAPGARLEELRVAASHPMALKQCAGSLRRLGLSGEAAFDTAGAARDLAMSPHPTRAAVASRAAAGLYGLEVVAEDLQDAPDNRTRFVRVARSPHPVAS